MKSIIFLGLLCFFVAFCYANNSLRYLQEGNVVLCKENQECGTGKYCYKDTCGGVGICQALPNRKCDRNWVDPVCGCDGNTYQNVCAAAALGFPVAHDGPCASHDHGSSSSSSSSSSDGDHHSGSQHWKKNKSSSSSDSSSESEDCEIEKPELPLCHNCDAYCPRFKTAESAHAQTVSRFSRSSAGKQD